MKLVIAGREFEVSDETVKKSLEDNAPVTIEDDVVIRKKEEDEQFVSNIKKEASTAAIEIAVKDVRTKLGLDFQGKKIDNLIEAVQAKTLADAKIEPEAKVKELMKDVETLKGTLSSVTAEKDQVLNQFNQYKNESTINNTLSSVIPDNVILPKDDMMLLVKSKMRFDVSESGVIALGSDGQPLKDKTTLNPLDAKTVVNQFFTENPQYLKTPGGGAGGDDSGGGSGKMTVDEFIALKEKQGISHTSKEFNDELQQLIKDGKVA